MFVNREPGPPEPEEGLAAHDLVIGNRFWQAGPLNVRTTTGQITAILGPSGCGKSTLLATLAGIEPALSGQVMLHGIDLTDVPVHHRSIGMVFQEPLLFPHLNVGANVTYGLRRQGVNKSVAAQHAAELLDWVGLPGFADRATDSLSGGQAQRVALARAMAPSPRALLLDEPFSALDTDLRLRLAGEVAELLRSRSITAIHVTHDLAEAHAMADVVEQFGDLTAR